ARATSAAAGTAWTGRSPAGGTSTPSRTSSVTRSAVATPVSRATGTPRSVMTTSSPSLARSIHDLSSARRALTGTSMPRPYRPGAPLCRVKIVRFRTGRARRPRRHRAGASELGERGARLLRRGARRLQEVDDRGAHEQDERLHLPVAGAEHVRVRGARDLEQHLARDGRVPARPDGLREHVDAR